MPAVNLGNSDRGVPTANPGFGRHMIGIALKGLYGINMFQSDTLVLVDNRPISERPDGKGQGRT